MSKETELRILAHKLIERITADEIEEFLELFEEDHFSAEERAELVALRTTEYWMELHDQ